MNKARFGSNDFREMRQERDDVVLHLAFDVVDARDVEDRVARLGPDCLRSFRRDLSKVRHGVGGMGLDLEPNAEFRLRRPNLDHGRAGIAGNHKRSRTFIGVSFRVERGGY
ncbi:hypothetical protein MnTg02_00666 [bacterium MnTg02]|nr:hypothetical protein MnTg02_00666 [bacterium MnTg02]